MRIQLAKGHPLAPPTGYVGVCRLVLYDKIGPGPHPCHWCGKELDWKPGGGTRAEGALIADHLNWNQADDRPENLVPSCNVCNAHRRQRGDNKIIQPGELTVPFGGQRTRAMERACEFCGSTFVVAIAAVKRGRGRFCTQSCARRGEKRPRRPRAS